MKNKLFKVFNFLFKASSIDKEIIIGQSLNYIKKKYSIENILFEYKIYDEFENRRFYMADLEIEKSCSKIIFADKINKYIYLFYPFFIPSKYSKTIRKYKQFIRTKNNEMSLFLNFINYEGNKDCFILE